MAYPIGQREVQVAAAASLATAADIGNWGTGLEPYIIRGVSLIFTTAVDATGALKVDKRPTAGSDTGRGDGDVATINYTTVTGAQGKGVFKNGLSIKVNPTEQVVFQVTDATPTAGAADLYLTIEPSPEEPANNTDLVATT